MTRTSDTPKRPGKSPRSPDKTTETLTRARRPRPEVAPATESDPSGGLRSLAQLPLFELVAPRTARAVEDDPFVVAIAAAMAREPQRPAAPLVVARPLVASETPAPRSPAPAAVTAPRRRTRPPTPQTAVAASASAPPRAEAAATAEPLPPPTPSPLPLPVAPPRRANGFGAVEPRHPPSLVQPEASPTPPVAEVIGAQLPTALSPMPQTRMRPKTALVNPYLRRRGQPPPKPAIAAPPVVVPAVETKPRGTSTHWDVRPKAAVPAPPPPPRATVALPPLRSPPPRAAVRQLPPSFAIYDESHLFSAELLALPTRFEPPPVEPAAAAFWETEDQLAQARWSPRPASAAAPIAHDDDDGSAGGHKRKRKRRRRRGGPVETELPVDSPEMATIVHKLRRQFGLNSFRLGQERIIRNVLSRVNTLAVMPTGSGKSLTFQLPAMVLPGVTIVVSPLLALMKDQTDKLRRRGITAARLDSTLTTVAERETLKAIDDGLRKLIYVTPERAGSADFKSELSGQEVSLFVIDEAHCVSQWGHDFRPSYLNLKRVLEDLDDPPVLALTATATPQVAQDIKERLGMPDADVVHGGFNRPELCFEVRATPDEKAQVKRLLRLMRRIRGCGIVYCSTINTVEALAGALPRLGIRVGKYHGKMTKTDRDREQQRFMKSQVRMMIATNAFGLGVDKPDIRFVIHYNLPGSVEQYYQEAGRAGRDGQQSRCVLLWRPGDEDVQEHFNSQKYPGRDQVRSVANALAAGPGKLVDIALRAGVPQKKAQVVLSMLEEANLASEESGGIWTPCAEAADEQVVWNAAEAYRKKREFDKERLKAMLDYTETKKCRVQFLLGYFGEEAPVCGRCDNCTGRSASDEDYPELPEEPVRPRIELPELPAPPRRDPTTLF